MMKNDLNHSSNPRQPTQMKTIQEMNKAERLKSI